jgi:hypothetical protein
MAFRRSSAFHASADDEKVSSSDGCCHRAVTGASVAFWLAMILDETLLCDACGERMTAREWGARGLLNGRDLCAACEAELADEDTQSVERLMRYRHAA